MEQTLKSIDEILHPESVAVVGVPRSLKTGKLFLMALLDLGFPGKIYPVSPHADEIDGLKAYPSVSAIPGPVDLAMVLVSQEQTLAVVRECAAKGVKGAILFTAGYKEMGTAEGYAREAEIVEAARSSGMRLIGPNCMGLYVPRSGLSFFPQLSKESGPVGIISQSGSLANMLCLAAPRQGIRFSKAISLGNECDLTSTDFLHYLGRDDETRVIGAYIEGIKDGPGFFDALKEASLRKPVIVWKAGLTQAGAQAASSHTGALAGSRHIWEGVAAQAGAVQVSGFEAWSDALMGFSTLTERLGDRIVIIAGPGGLAVSAAEACGENGLRLSQLSDETRATLAEVLPATGTSVRNPVDVGLTGALDVGLYIHSVQTVIEDPAVDAAVIIGAGFDPEGNRRMTEAILKARRESGKAILMVKIPGVDYLDIPQFCTAGIPYFNSSERAMKTYALIRKYQAWRRNAAGLEKEPGE